ncbi:MAG TPA: hypothetical protein VIT38_07485 [Allosphingosinicella sp.]|jgi:hypothetical protein
MGRNTLPSERQWLSKTIIGLGLLSVAASAGLAGSQAWKRYDEGFWTLYSTAQLFTDLGIPYPHGLWSSAQPTIDWIMYQAATGVLLAAGLLLWAIGRLIRALH